MGDQSGAKAAEQAQLLKQGEQLFSENCVMCHNGGDPAAPALEALKQMKPEAILAALTNGKMMQQGSALSAAQKQSVTNWLTAGQKSYADWAQNLSCKSPLSLPANATRWLDRWGVTDDNHRYQRQSAINAGNIGSIRQAWSIAFPGAATMRSQPVILGDALFVAVSDTQSIYAFNRETGCLFWTRDLGKNLRSALSLATMADGRHALVVGDESGGVSVVDAQKGDVIWQKNVGVDRFSAITGPITVRGDVLYVPQSTTETIASVDPKYECCRASGAVSANRLSDGSRIWLHRIVREPAARGKTKDGVAQWGPAGASVWAAPVIDDKRGLIYVGTGPISAPPDEGVGDSIIAIDMKTGTPRWTFQATKNDLWNGACRAPYPGGLHPNCPGTTGVDFDFGAGLIRARDARGRDLLIAGQKSGTVYALEPDSGKVVWKTSIGSGGLLGGIHWGMTIANGALFVPVNDPDFSKNPGLSESYRSRLANYTSKVGLYRLDLATGSVIWKWAPLASCKGEKCPPQFGLSGAAFATNDIILSGGMDGNWRAFSATGGKPLFEASTFQDFTNTLNKVPGRGGSIDNSTLVAADDMIFVQSGYGYFGGSPGNMLIAYRLPEKK
ncbi:MAG: PQQ-binding-like beta-propeller repeat protein [Parasphingorhabdus sp.]|nr:PQQ-binding-like beta-propeller repeat protein [Parasphingorhabdus sp.]